MSLTGSLCGAGHFDFPGDLQDEVSLRGLDPGSRSIRQLRSQIGEDVIAVLFLSFCGVETTNLADS